MSFWNSAIGAMIGFTLGGPLGALIGGVLGSRFGKSNSAFNINKNQQHQVAFFTALFACFAKLAKADGIVTKGEIRSIDFVIKNKLKFNSEQRALAIRVFNQAKEDKNSFEDYASQLSSLLKENPNALLFFYELLFELAISDKLLHKNEEKLLLRALTIFNLDQNIFENLKSQFLLKDTNNAYAVLGVSEDMSLEEIKKIYRKKRKEFHPDSLISKGLPEELINKAKEKFIEIQEAYEAIKSKKSD